MCSVLQEPQKTSEQSVRRKRGKHLCMGLPFLLVKMLLGLLTPLPISMAVVSFKHGPMPWHLRGPRGRQQQVHGMARSEVLSDCPRRKLGEDCAGLAAAEAAGIRSETERI